MEPNYKTVFNRTTLYRGILAPDGTVRAANDTILAFTGSSREQVIGTELWKVPGVRFSERTQQQVRADVRKAAKGEIVRHELTVQGAERTALVDFSLQPMTDKHGDVTHLIAEGYDITALKQQDAVTSQTRHGQTHTNLLVTYSRDADEPMSEAILNAFLALDIDIYEMDRTLQDWVDTDLLDGFDWHSARPLTIRTRLWGYSVELTVDAVRIYTDIRS
ncbi:PAS domain-containing protein [Haloarchaeobius litoreus]|uniref:PAS domain-containing protein n=1 Tax=Haloarchaeobius litoreus TaxID=755306 RepID=A0ABD6DNS7_9EURY|nr:PAS domain-containing protein [Haloarchaeobius litoreus]